MEGFEGQGEEFCAAYRNVLGANGGMQRETEQ